MKLLSITVPCYNSQEYMGKCLDSLLPGGEDVEIIIVDDGSTDRTGEIADEYAKKNPGIVRAIHQENGGHGQAVNTGLGHANGLFFKVVDSDDWVNQDAYQAVLSTLEEMARGPHTLDMLVSNFVYDKQGMRRKKVMQYRKCFPQGEIFGWNQVKHMRTGKYILMHSVIYRTQLLKSCGLHLPEHTFYVDNLFVFEPLPFVSTIYYLDVNFYRYYIGRQDQSVHESVMIERIDQQIRVNKRMIDVLAGTSVKSRQLRKYMERYLTIITAVSSVMLIRSGKEENLEKKAELWKYLKAADKSLYRKVRHGIVGGAVNLPGKGGRSMSSTLYKICQKFYGFN